MSLDQSKIDEFLPVNDRKFSRKKKILSLKLRGFNNSKISSKLGWSLSTIEKDVFSIRKILGNILREIKEDVE